jgi:hypothetical protein
MLGRLQRLERLQLLQRFRFRFPLLFYHGALVAELSRRFKAPLPPRFRFRFRFRFRKKKKKKTRGRVHYRSILHKTKDFLPNH